MLWEKKKMGGEIEVYTEILHVLKCFVLSFLCRTKEVEDNFRNVTVKEAASHGEGLVHFKIFLSFLDFSDLRWIFY